MSYDLILEEIGEFGKWQRFVFLLAGLCGGGGAFVHYTWTFVGFMPEDYRCVWRKMFHVTLELIGNYLKISLLSFCKFLGNAIWPFNMFLDHHYYIPVKRTKAPWPTQSLGSRKTIFCHSPISSKIKL